MQFSQLHLLKLQVIHNDYECFGKYKSYTIIDGPLLLGGKSSTQYNLLKPKEYKQLASYLVEIKKQPADLLTNQAEEILDNYPVLDKSRIIQL